MIVPAILTVQQHNYLTIGLFGVAANREMHYSRYFSMLPAGPDPMLSFSEGFFAVAMQIEPRPKTIAISGADAEFSKVSTAGQARELMPKKLASLSCTTKNLSTLDHGFWSCRAGDPVNQRRNRLQRGAIRSTRLKLSELRPRSRPQNQNVRRQYDRITCCSIAKGNSDHCSMA